MKFKKQPAGMEQVYQEHVVAMMRKKGRKMLKELRPGKIVYYVHGLGAHSSITQYKITSKPYVANRLDSDIYLKDFIFVRGHYKNAEGYSRFESNFSLWDCNVLPNHHNDHRLFLTPQAAVRYYNWALKNTPEPTWTGITSKQKVLK